MSKYQNLENHLSQQSSNQVTMSFVDIESLIGCPLPNSARKHRQWWENQENPAPDNRQCAVWMNAGYKAYANMKNEIVTFIKYNKSMLCNSVDDEMKKRITEYCVDAGEIDNIRKIIIKNKSVDDNQVIYDHGDWFSNDGNSFARTSLEYKGVSYRLEINSDGELFVFNQSGEMDEDMIS